ncbi:MAG: fused MFS/spermidine synthase, partial [Myxococcales bacterium]|nr:fused MFS/spermidine synthase [Myxococcales bacterium]
MPIVWSRRSLMAGLAALPTVGSARPAERRLARRRTRFGTLEVVERDGVVVLLEDSQIHSAFDPADPDRFHYDYLDTMAAAVRLRAATGATPRRALVVGLGGGSFSRFLLGQGYAVDGVDINPVVVRLARRYLGLDPRIAVHIADGRTFLNDAEPGYELIVLDAQSEDYVPPQLVTLECFQRVRALLTPSGMAVMNSWHHAPRADDELATWHAAFGGGAVVWPVTSEYDNRILLATPGGGDPASGLPETYLRLPVADDVGQVRHD